MKSITLLLCLFACPSLQASTASSHSLSVECSELTNACLILPQESPSSDDFSKIEAKAAESLLLITDLSPESEVLEDLSLELSTSHSSFLAQSAQQQGNQLHRSISKVNDYFQKNLIPLGPAIDPRYSSVIFAKGHQ